MSAVSNRKRRYGHLDGPESAVISVSSVSCSDSHCSMDDLPSVPLSDHNMWYYPSHGHDSDEEDISIGPKTGNWGCKNAKGARWVRRGKITPWGPGMEDWEVSQLSDARNSPPDKIG
jgi:hypothetical protein